MPRPAPDPLTEQRIESRTDAERQALIVRKESECEPDNRIDRPGREPPMEDRGAIREPFRFG